MAKRSNADGFDPSISRVRVSPAQFIWAYGEIWQHAVALGATVERRGGSSPLTPITVMNRCCSWLNSFDHYYSQLASDGAVVLCKLGLHAAMVLVVSTSAFQAERASSSLVSCSIYAGIAQRLEHWVYTPWSR